MAVSCVFVGGGLSGLVAAFKLLQSSTDDMEVLVLEGSNIFGGRLRSSEGGVDLGGAWSWQNDVELRALSEHLGVATIEQQWQGKLIIGNVQREAEYGEVACGPGGVRFRGGAVAIIKKLVERLQDDPRCRLILGSKVTACKVLSDKIELRVHGNEAEIITKHCVFAMPPQTITSCITFTPTIDDKFLLRMRRTQTWMAGMGKAIVKFDKPWWKELGFSAASHNVNGDVFDCTWDNSDHENEFYAIAGFVHRMANEEDILKDLSNIFKLDVRLQGVMEVECYIWDMPGAGFNGETTSLYGYDQCGHKLSSDNHLLLFAGTESEQEHGHMEGAVRSGIRCAARLHDVLCSNH